MVLQSRLALSTVRALSKESSLKPTAVTMLSDSECSISAVDKSTSILKPFFHNRVSEIQENILEMRSFCQVEDIHHVKGNFNPADLATRGTTKASDLRPDGVWWKGPSFLQWQRDLWPVSRAFITTPVPVEEIRARRAVLFSLMHATSNSSESPGFPDLWKAVNRILNYSNSLLKVSNILARVIRGWKVG